MYIYIVYISITCIHSLYTACLTYILVLGEGWGTGGTQNFVSRSSENYKSLKKKRGFKEMEDQLWKIRLILVILKELSRTSYGRVNSLKT